MKRLSALVGAVTCLVSCAADPDPAGWMRAPQFLSTSAETDIWTARLEARMSRTTGMTGCGFTVEAEGFRQECPSDRPGETFEVRLSSLTPDTEYRFRAYVDNGPERILSAESRFRTGIHVELLSSVAEPGVFQTRLTAVLSRMDVVEEAGFEVERDGGWTPVSSGVERTENGFSLLLEDLSPETDYRCRAFFMVQGRRTTGDDILFRTLPESGNRILSTGVKSDVRSALLTASLSMDRGLGTCGFGIGKDGEAFREFTVPSDGLSFSLHAEGLEPDTAYRFYAFAEAYGRRFQSEEKVFYTLPVPFGEISFIALSADPARDSVRLSATLSTPDATLSEVGFGISVNGMDFTEYGASQDGDRMTVVLNGLSPGTEYLYYAFFVCKGSRAQSEYGTFTTQN